jgi:hypothetical protein
VMVLGFFLSPCSMVSEQYPHIAESYFEAQNHNAYHKLLEENRKLYNQVQDLKGKPQMDSVHLVSSKTYCY